MSIVWQPQLDVISWQTVVEVANRTIFMIFRNNKIDIYLSGQLLSTSKFLSAFSFKMIFKGNALWFHLIKRF